MDKPYIIDVLTDLNRELETNPLLEFVTMMTIANNKIKRERRRAKEENTLSDEQIDKLVSLYNNIKNYVSSNDLIVKLMVSSDMEPVYAQCGITKIDDLDNKVNAIKNNKRSTSMNEFDNVYGCMEKTFVSLQEVIKRFVAKTGSVPVVPPAPVADPRPVDPPHPPGPMPRGPPPRPISYSGPIEKCDIAECKDENGDANIRDQIKAAVDHRFFLYFDEYDNYKLIGGSDEEQLAGTNESLYTKDELISILNNNIRLLGGEKISTLYKIIKDVVFYLYQHQHFKSKGTLGGYFAGWDFTLGELKKYMDDPTKSPNTWKKDTLVTWSSKIMALYLLSLCRVMNTVYYTNNTKHIASGENFLDKIKAYENKSDLVKDKITGMTYQNMIKENDGTGFIISQTDFKLIGGSLNNDNQYYEKYMKYKAKYMKLKSENI